LNIAATAWRLGLAGAVVAAAIGGVDALTRARIQANEQRVRFVPLVEVTGDARLANLRGSATPPLTVCSASGAPLYRVFVRSTRGYAGPIELLIGVDAKNALTGVRAISHRETAGIGDAIDTRKSLWIHSFARRRLADVALIADGGSIDAISGASVTSRAVIEGVHDALEEVVGAPSQGCSNVVDE